MEDYMSFKKMITPTIIQLLFWILVVVVVVAGVVSILNKQVLVGILTIIVGPIALRIYAELLMVLFRINTTLTEVSDSLRQIQNNTTQRS